MKFLLAQINPVVGDLEGNAKKILYMTSKASSISADLVLTPELSLRGYPANDLLLKTNLIKKQYQILDQIQFLVFCLEKDYLILQVANKMEILQLVFH